jgi:glycosyltransferase involved in cell wall biosynthesis
MDTSVSVIIPVYNCERYLAEAINSVLAQTHPAHEIIVVDDGSTDSSAQVARRFGSAVRYAFQPNAGIGAARNRGVRLALGNFFAFLDADDLWTDDKLRQQLAAVAEDPRLDAVFGLAKQFHSPELDAVARSRIQCPARPAPGYVAGSMLIRRSAFEGVGPFETGWRVGEFVDWYLRATEAGLRERMLPEVVLHRRLHATNQGVRERAAATDYARILKASLDRRRRATGGTP